MVEAGDVAKAVGVVEAIDAAKAVDVVEAGDVDLAKVSLLVDIAGSQSAAAAVLTPANALFARAGSEIPAQNGCPKAQLLGPQAIQ